MRERGWIKTAGYSDNTEEKKLYFDLISRCGDIDDGVGFSHGRSGGWVVSFADLEGIVEQARAARVGRERSK